MKLPPLDGYPRPRITPITSMTLDHGINSPSAAGTCRYRPSARNSNQEPPGRRESPSPNSHQPAPAALKPSSYHSSAHWNTCPAIRDLKSGKAGLPTPGKRSGGSGKLLRSALTSTLLAPTRVWKSPSPQGRQDEHQPGHLTSPTRTPPTRSSSPNMPSLLSHALHGSSSHKAVLRQGPAEVARMVEARVGAGRGSGAAATAGRPPDYPSWMMPKSRRSGPRWNRLPGSRVRGRSVNPGAGPAS